MSIIISTIVLGILFSGIVFGLIKFFQKKKEGTGSGGNMTAIEEEINSISEAVEQGLAYCGEMIPYNKLKSREGDLEHLNRQLGEERAKLEKLDKQVEGLQGTIEVEEASHNELKKGKEEAGELAEQLRMNKEKLESEFSRLEADLTRSLTEVSALSTEIEMTSDQKIACDKVQSGLENARLQLSTLADIYTQASTRFTNLENQYQELEGEFTKLVEKELGGQV